MKNPLLLACAALLTLAAPSTAFAASSISIEPFRSVELRGGGHVLLHHGPLQRVTMLEGSTQFTRFHVKRDGQLVIAACDDNCPHHYDLEIEIVTPRIDGAAIEGGGKIESDRSFGRQNAISVAIQGGGHIDIRSIDAGHADAAVDGGGDIALRAEQSLEAAVNGGGNIFYWGNPSVTSAVSGGGNVSKSG